MPNTIDADVESKKHKQAKNAVVNAISAGKLKKGKKCNKCGKTGDNMEAHHNKGYDKENQLSVIWLCTTCHHAAHSKKNKKDSVQRYDVMEDTEFWLTKTFKKDGNGYLNGDAIVTNIGVFTYKFKDGTILRELRPPEEVLHFDSIATLKMKPITNNHPTVLVDVNNIKEYQVGTTGSQIHTDAYAVAVPISVQQQKAISDIEDGKVALSCGYTADLDYTPGTWGGVEYDAIQRNIRYNHVAIVDKARAGDLSKIRMDSEDWKETDAFLQHEKDTIITGADSTGDNNINNQNNNGGLEMPDNLNLKTIRLDDGVEYKADAEVIRAFTSSKKALETANQVKVDFDNYKKDNETKLSKSQADLDTANDKLKVANDEIEKLKKDTMSDEAIQAAIDERIAIADQAVKAKVEIKKDMKNLDIKKAVILKIFPEAKLDEKDEVYIDARYDSAVDILAKQPAANNKQKVFGDKSKSASTNNNDGEKNIVEDAQAKYIEDLENAWKNDKEGK